MFMDLLLSLFFLLFLLTEVVAAQNCSALTCGDNNVPIRFPFQLEGDKRQNCSYPGFKLNCSIQGNLVLKLPLSGEFFVRSINYSTQQIELLDPGNCLLGRLLRLNLSGSPFSFPHFTTNYTFFNCQKNMTTYGYYQVIDCLSNDTNAVVAMSAESRTYTYMSPYCKMIATVPIPRDSSYYFLDIKDAFNLSWDEPHCMACEWTGGICSFGSDASNKVGCTYAKKGSTTVMIALLAGLLLGIPTIICSLLVVLLQCRRSADIGGNDSYDSHENNANATSIERRRPTSVTRGLKECTIESFTKIVLGESRRVEGPNGSVCPICWSEYLPREILRFIPECKHCFHADCLDKWLREHSTCSLCRNSPSPALAASDKP